MRLSKRIIFLASVSLILTNCANFDLGFKPNRSFAAVSNYTKSDLNVTFLNLNNELGDATLIEFYDKTILIDAGGTVADSADVIYEAVKGKNCLDFAIFTHADTDHIVNFSSELGGLTKWFKESGHYIDTLIDFDITQDPYIRDSSFYYPCKNNLYKNATGLKNTDTYDNYKYLRDSNVYSVSNLNPKIKKYFPASECVWKERGISDISSNALSHKYPIYDSNNSIVGQEYAKSSFSIRGNNNDSLTIDVLYNYFFDHPLTSSLTASSAQRNIISVPILMTYKTSKEEKKMLFCGDLEEFDSGSVNKQNNTFKLDGEIGEVVDLGKPYERIYGESMLVALNYDLLKDGVTLYKANHHGSYTSNSANLLDVIRPQYIGITTALSAYKYPQNGESTKKRRYKFPSDIALQNMLKWTDKIFVTSKCDYEGNVLSPLFGSVIFGFNSGETKIYSEIKGDVTSYSFFQDGYNYNNRFLGFNVFTLDANEDVILKLNEKELKSAISKVKSRYSSNPVTKDETSFDLILKLFNPNSSNKDSELIYNCTYIKIGHIDILINSGNNSLEYGIDQNLDKINSLCNDHILDYLLVSNGEKIHIRNLIGNLSDKNGLIYQGTTNIKKILNYVEYEGDPNYFIDEIPDENVVLTQYKSAIESGINTGYISNYFSQVRKVFRSGDTKKQAYFSTQERTNLSEYLSFDLLNDSNNVLKFNLTVLDSEYNALKDSKSESCYKVGNNAFHFLFNVDFAGKNLFSYLKTSEGLYDQEEIEKLYRTNQNLIGKKIHLVDVPSHGMNPNEKQEKKSSIYSLEKGFISNISSPDKGIISLFNGSFGVRNYPSSYMFRNSAYSYAMYKVIPTSFNDFPKYNNGNLVTNITFTTRQNKNLRNDLEVNLDVYSSLMYDYCSSDTLSVTKGVYNKDLTLLNKRSFN